MSSLCALRLVVYEALATGHAPDQALSEAAKAGSYNIPASSIRSLARAVESGEVARILREVGEDVEVLSSVAEREITAVATAARELDALPSPKDAIARMSSTMLFFLIVIAIQALVALFLLPGFREVYTDLGGEVPAAASILYALGRGLVLATALVLIALWTMIGIPSAGARLFCLLVPDLEPAKRTIGALALVRAGVPAPEALTTVGAAADVLLGRILGAGTLTDNTIAEAARHLREESHRQVERFLEVFRLAGIASLLLIGLLLAAATYLSIYGMPSILGVPS